MNQDVQETQVSVWEELHPWLAQNMEPEEDSLDEVIRYTLDELRLA